MTPLDSDGHFRPRETTTSADTLTIPDAPLADPAEAEPLQANRKLWHLFVLAGAGAHCAFTYSLVDLSYAPF